MAAKLTEFIPFEDPRFYAGDPYPVFARLQRENPVCYYEPLDVFVLTKLDDVREAAGQAAIFSSGHGLFLNDIRMMLDDAGGTSVFDGFFPAGAEHFAFADPPRHKTLRGLIAPAFSARNLASLKPAIEDFADELLAKIKPGEPIDFVAEVADELPVMIATRLLGISVRDTGLVKKWSDALEAMNSVDTTEEIE